MRILVLGGSGFIGGRLLAKLSHIPAEVIAGSRRVSQLESAGNISHISIDGTNFSDLKRAAAGVTHIVNCVMGRPSAMIASTRNLLEVAHLTRVERVVHMSSVSVYGATHGNIDERSERLARDWYGKAKISCENLVLEAASKGLNVVMLRPALVHGPGSELWTHRIGELLQAHRLGDLGACGDGFCNLVYVEDVVNAISSALFKDDTNGKTYNISSCNPPTWNEYLRFFARELRAVPLSSIPEWQLTAEANIGAPLLRALRMLPIEKIFGRKVAPAITPALRRLFKSTVRYNSTAMRELLPNGETPWRSVVQQVSSQRFDVQPL